MEDAYVRLRRAGEQNLRRSGGADKAADGIVGARAETIIKLAGKVRRRLSLKTSSKAATICIKKRPTRIEAGRCVRVT